MKKLNKALSVALSLALCAGLVAPALAASFTDLQNAINLGEDQKNEAGNVTIGASKDETGAVNITLYDTVTGESDENITISGDKNITLDLNGHNVEGSYGDFWTKGMIEVNTGSSLTVKDETGEGEIRNSNNNGNTVYVKGEMTLESGTIAADNGTLKSVLVDGGSFTMEGGKIDGGSEAGLGVMGDKGTATVKNGEVSGKVGVTAQQGGKIQISEDDDANVEITGIESGIHVNNGASATIEGGTVTGGTAGVSATNNGTLELTGGTIHSASGPKGSHADIELSNAAGTNTVKISEGVTFETLGIQGDGSGDVKNVITVEGKYRVTYSGDRQVIIESLGEESVDKLYDVVKKMVVKNGDQKGSDDDWKWIFLGPEAVKDPANQIPPTEVKYAYVSGTEGRELPENLPEPLLGADTSDIRAAGGKWVFQGWPEDPFAGLEDVDGKPANGETESMFDAESKKHIDTVIIEGTWTFVADPVIPDYGFDFGGDEVEIDEPDVPLAGLFTRADAIGYLWRQAGEPEAELSDFPDVDADHEWAVAIGWAQDVGIALPDMEGNFRPDDLVERFVEDAQLKPEGELQEFLNRYAVYAGIQLNEDELFYVLGGEAADIVMGEDAQVIFDDFFAKLEAALADQAA